MSAVARLGSAASGAVGVEAFNHGGWVGGRVGGRRRRVGPVYTRTRTRYATTAATAAAAAVHTALNNSYLLVYYSATSMGARVIIIALYRYI